MKKGKMIWLAVLAALVLVPTMAWAQAQTRPMPYCPPGTAAPAVAPVPTTLPVTEPSFFAELYIGGGTATQSGKMLRTLNVRNINSGNNLPGTLDPYVLGGIKIGYWFTPYGTYAASWYSDWMQYLGFYTDFSYHRLNFSNQNGTFNVGAFTGTLNGETNGSLATWAFMFAGRYGFLPDSEVPFGRLQPYIGVGPTISSPPPPTVNLGPAGIFAGRSISAGYKDSINVGLAAELGLRYMITKAISTEISFKYRYFAPSYSYSGNNFEIQARPEFNLFSGQFGMAYHF